MQDKHYRELVEHWLEKEPLLLKVLCGTGHEIVENTTMFCAIRSGAGRIEINPSLTNRYQFNKYEEVVKAEMLRLLLKHPLHHSLSWTACPLQQPDRLHPPLSLSALS